MLLKSTTAIALLASFVAAQTGNSSTIDPNSVQLSTRASWCLGQENTCGTLCDGSMNANTCDPNTLQYSCLCQANNSEPGLRYYDVTLPTFICEQVFANCDRDNANNKAGKDKCAETRRQNCGTLKIANFTSGGAATTSSSETTTSTSAPSGTQSNTAAGVTSTSSSRAIAAPTGTSNFGTGVLAAGVAAAFGLML